jgi:hypothetical protein
VVTFALILIAGAAIKQKANVDAFRADKVWLYITILTVRLHGQPRPRQGWKQRAYTEDPDRNGRN